MDEIKIASLLCSRLCHDLVSPIGALNNGVEVLEDETSASVRKEAIALLSESARAAIGKLLFFRVAFGAATGFGSEITMSEVKQAAEGVFSHSRVKLDWPQDLTIDQMLPKTVAKLLLNFIMMAGESLMKGGTVRPVIERGTGEFRIAALAKGAGATLHDSLVSALRGGVNAEEVEVRTAQPWYAHRIAANVGATIDVMVDQPDIIEISAKFKNLA